MSYQSRGRTFDHFEEDEVITTPRRTITENAIERFAGLSGDFNPLHTDEEFARETPFGTRIAHGMLVAAIATGLANQSGVFEGTTIALLQQTIRYKEAVFPGDTVHLELTVAGKRESSKPDRGLITFDAAVKNQRDETVIDGQWVLLMRRESPDDQ
ncbi:MAG: MaoC family dehydratase N-terminal domain-containing protein [Chloroflexota bacterium]|nr:MaoC family dehydratase N-terminal domain-containing protein [Chloroflexota bacterium]